MSKHLGFFGLLSAGMTALESTTAPVVDSLEPEEQTALLTVLSQYQRLVDQCENLNSESTQQSAQLNPSTLAKQYAALFAQYQEEIEESQLLLSNQEQLTRRYQRLFDKYQRKLNDTNLSHKQRIRYTKLCNQYEELFRLYS
jgi:hypothetical protein